MEIKGQYLTYEEYKGLGGNLDQAPFNLLEYEARKIIDKNTLGRLTNLKTQKEETKLCIFNIIDKVDINNKTNGKSSESVGSYSVSYNTTNTTQDINETIKTYLSNCYLEDGTPYLYCGV